MENVGRPSRVWEGGQIPQHASVRGGGCVTVRKGYGNGGQRGHDMVQCHCIGFGDVVAGCSGIGWGEVRLGPLRRSGGGARRCL